MAPPRAAPAPGAAFLRWYCVHPGASGRSASRAHRSQVHPADVLVDGMRGSSSLWYRIRVNLQHVPEAERPEQGGLEADYRPPNDPSASR